MRIGGRTAQPPAPQPLSARGSASSRPAPHAPIPTFVHRYRDVLNDEADVAMTDAPPLGPGLRRSVSHVQLSDSLRSNDAALQARDRTWDPTSTDMRGAGGLGGPSIGSSRLRERTYPPGADLRLPPLHAISSSGGAVRSGAQESDAASSLSSMSLAREDIVAWRAGLPTRRPRSRSSSPERMSSTYSSYLAPPHHLSASSSSTSSLSANSQDALEQRRRLSQVPSLSRLNLDGDEEDKPFGQPIPSTSTSPQSMYGPKQEEQPASSSTLVGRPPPHQPLQQPPAFRVKQAIPSNPMPLPAAPLYPHYYGRTIYDPRMPVYVGVERFDGLDFVPPGMAIGSSSLASFLVRTRIRWSRGRGNSLVLYQLIHSHPNRSRDPRTGAIYGELRGSARRSVRPAS